MQRKKVGMIGWVGAGDWETDYTSVIFFMIFKIKMEQMNEIIETRYSYRCDIFDSSFGHTCACCWVWGSGMESAAERTIFLFHAGRIGLP